MPHTILYYPNIAIPTKNWLRRVILYWDEVGSIVPQGYDYAKHPEVEFLISEGVYRPFDPTNLFSNWELLQDLNNELLAVMISPRFRQQVSQKKSRLHRSKIHTLKLPDEVREILIQEQLVERPNGYSDWYLFETTTAKLYMSLLAKYLAYADGKNTFPGTDSPTYQGLSYYSTDNVSPGLNVDFFNILPVPREDVSFADILAFKEKRKTELDRFRNILSQTQKTIIHAQSQQEFNDSLSGMESRLKQGLSELEATLKDSKILYWMGNVSSLALTTGAGAFLGLPPELAVAGTIGLKITEVSIRSYLGKRGILRNSELSYLYHAQKAEILQ